MASLTSIKTFRVEFEGIITADVYVGMRKIASPGDRVEVGDLARGRKTLCRIAGALYWIENSAFDAR
jgi:hypothetical protein